MARKLAAVPAAAAAEADHRLPEERLDDEIARLDKLRDRIDKTLAEEELTTRGIPALIRERTGISRAMSTVSAELRALALHEKNRARDLPPEGLAKSAVQIVRDLPLELRRQVLADLADLATEGILSK
jgi:hypothetical protein